MKGVLFFLLGMSFFTSNAQTKQEFFDYGKVENNKYTNSFFAFEMTVPQDWTVQSKEQIEEIMDAGKEMVTGDNAQLKSIIDASEVRTANLLSVYQYELGSKVEFNPSIMLISENVQQIPSIRTGSDYLFESRKLLEHSQVKYDYIDEDFQKEKIDGRSFYKMNAAINYNKMDIKQVYYSTIIKGFALNAIISYVTNEQKKELLNIISTMKFAQK